MVRQGCINFGSGTRRIEAQVVGILDKKEQDWRLLCGSMPMTWNGTTYDTATHCDERVGGPDRFCSNTRYLRPPILQIFGRKVAIWDIPDEEC